MPKLIVLLSNVPEDDDFVTEVANAAFCELHRCRTFPELEASVESADLDSTHFFIDAAHLAAFEKCRGADQINPNQVHLIGPDAVEDYPVAECGGLFGHYVVRRYGNPRETGAHYGKVLLGLEEGDDIGLEHLISRQGSISLFTLNHSSDKTEALNSISAFLSEDAGFDGRMNNVIVNAVDELLMNAIYDAPVDEKGDQALKLIPRNTPIELSGQKAVELQMGFDGDYAAFIVTDHFGTINKAQLLKHLFTKMTEESYPVNDARAIACLGLLTTFRTGGSLIFLSNPGVKTEVAVYFRKARSFKEFRTQFRFISVQVGSARAASPLV